MPMSKYTTEQIEFVKNSKHIASRETISEFGKRFGINITLGQLIYLRKLAGIDCNSLDKPLGHNWIETERQWLRDNVKGITTYELHSKFNKHFGLNLTYEQVKNQKKRLMLSNGLDCTFKKGQKGYPRGIGYQHYFTTEQLQFIQDNVKNPNIKLAQLFNERFGTSLTPHKMYGAKHRHGIKGAPKGCHGTSFYSGYMKGREHPDRYPEGTKKMWGRKNPTAKCKTDDPGIWDSPGRVTWRKVHGEIPEGYMVRYLDGNPLNNAIENLELVSRSENAFINRRKLFVNDAELNKTACLIAKVMSATRKVERGAK